MITSVLVDSKIRHTILGWMASWWVRVAASNTPIPKASLGRTVIVCGVTGRDNIALCYSMCEYS